MLLLIRKIETLHLCKAEQHVALTDVNSLHSCIVGNCATTATKISKSDFSQCLCFPLPSLFFLYKSLFWSCWGFLLFYVRQQRERGAFLFVKIHWTPLESSEQKPLGCSVTARPLAPAKTQAKGATELEQNSSCLSLAIVFSAGGQGGRVASSLFPSTFQTWLLCKVKWE